MVLDNAWWPSVAMVAGGIHLDASGREAAKVWSLKEHRVRVGTPGERIMQNVFFILMGVLTLRLLAYAFFAVAVEMTGL